MNVDINLLMALTVLLAERHVTRAAQRVSMSQPAMSDCLRRLRRHYHDELLTRDGNRLELTPLGRSLVEPATATLKQVQRTFAVQCSFDPSTSSREFVLHASDYVVALLGAELARRFSPLAPRAVLRLPLLATDDADGGAARLRRGAGAILPLGVISQQLSGLIRALQFKTQS